MNIVLLSDSQQCIAGEHLGSDCGRGMLRGGTALADASVALAADASHSCKKEKKCVDLRKAQAVQNRTQVHTILCLIACS
jgi:hypothetical protein